VTPRGFQAACMFALLSMTIAHAAETPREVHGSADAVAVPGMALAWGVLRGANEAATMVVIRIATDPHEFAEMDVTGGDPFTQHRQVVFARATSTGSADLRVPRAHFAEFPRTEFRFYPPQATPLAAPLLVFYLGVPDTTPEFADEARLDAYLRDRIAKVRGNSRP